MIVLECAEIISEEQHFDVFYVEADIDNVAETADRYRTEFLGFCAANASVGTFHWRIVKDYEL